MKLINVNNNVLKNHIHYITSDYKNRNSSRNNHSGIDLIGKNKSTDYIIAIDSGVIKKVSYSKDRGYYVEIKHNNGYISRYLHMKKGSIIVKEKDYVNKEDIIGYMGSTGNSSGSHLHLSILTKNKVIDDPLIYLYGYVSFFENYYEDFIIKLERLFNIKEDGIAGKEVLNNTITVSKNINRNHKIVEILQIYFTKLGYNEIGKIDGIAGPKFERTVKHFQKDNGCIVDGVITKRNKTWKKLLKLE